MGSVASSGPNLINPFNMSMILHSLNIYPPSWDVPVRWVGAYGYRAELKLPPCLPPVRIGKPQSQLTERSPLAAQPRYTYYRLAGLP